MTVRNVFTKAVFISLVSHVTFFSIFSLSFGNRIPALDCAAVSFWGQLLSRSQVLQPASLGPRLKDSLRAKTAAGNDLILPKKNAASLDKPAPDAGLEPYQLKPALALSFAAQKPDFAEKPGVFLFTAKRKEPLLLFHPALPYGFNLYFKDRQVAHVELDFNIESKGRRTLITVKRKISSGNLEVDLLSARYIGHYLFIQHSRFLPDRWQTVKIDLSAHD